MAVEAAGGTTPPDPAPAVSPVGKGPAGGGRAWPWFLLAFAVLGPLLLWPLGAILWRALSADGDPAAATVTEVLSDRFYWERLWFTTWQAAASTALALVVGLPGAWVFAQHRFPGRSVLLALFTVPFVLPTLVVALAMQELLGPEGWLNAALDGVGLGPVEPLGTVWAILAAHVFYNVSIVLRLVGGAWANLDPRSQEAARMLGAGRVAVGRHVTLPALAPAVGAAAALVFVFSFTSFGVVLVLGGPGLDTLEVVIFRLATRLVDLPAAAVLSTVQIVTTLVALTISGALGRRALHAQALRADRAPGLRAVGRARRLGVVLVLLVLGAWLLAPLAALVHAALTVDADGAVTGRHFADLFRDSGRLSYIEPLQAVRWSLTLAAGSAVAALGLGLVSALALHRRRGRWSAAGEALLMLPLAVPAVVLGLGYVITFNRDPVDLRGSVWLLLVAHTLVGYPFVVRAVLPALRRIDPRLPEAARMLGASPRQVWRRIDLPLTARAVSAGALFAFAVSLGEFGATALLQRREFATMPVAIFDALGRPGVDSLGRALAMSVLLAGVTALSFLLIERIRFRDIGEF